MTLVPCVLTSQKFLRKELLFVMCRRIHGGISCITHNVRTTDSQLQLLLCTTERVLCGWEYLN